MTKCILTLPKSLQIQIQNDPAFKYNCLKSAGCNWHQVSVADGEEDHEHDEIGIVVKQDRQVSLSRSRVAVHEEGDEDDPRDGKQDDDGSTARPASGHLNPRGKTTSDLKHLKTLGLVFL